MIVEIISLTEEAIKERDYCDAIKIEIDGKAVFSVYDGEPEDNTLNRNFNDCRKINNLMQKAYDAGKAGHSFEIIYLKVDEI